MTLHPLRLTNSVLDPIHGLIRMTPEEREVADHPLFQRLRRIRQNGLLYLVFPSANHTRFEHSLGAMFVADGVLQALHFNSLVADAKGSNPDDTAPRLVDWKNEKPEELVTLYRVARLAALCHDLGHGPLSHAYEGFAPKSSCLEGLLRAPEVQSISVLQEMLREECEKKHGRLTHEVLSAVLFAKVWHDIKKGEEPKIPLAVARAIIGKSSKEDGTLRWVPLVHDIIASAPADADRMDYLERDSRFCGVTYGLFDRSRLLKSFLAYYESGSQTPRLGIKYSGCRAVENFVQARFELFVQIYYHKTNRAIELMLKRIARLAGEKNLCVSNGSTLQELEETLCWLSDERFVSALCGEGDEAFRVRDVDINDLGRALRERKLWKRIYDDGEAPLPAAGQESRANKIHDDLVSEFGDEFELDVIPPDATKDLDKGARILLKSPQGGYCLAKRSWTEVSSVISALAQNERSMKRIYYRSADSTKAKEIRKKALALADGSRE